MLPSSFATSHGTSGKKGKLSRDKIKINFAWPRQPEPGTGPHGTPEDPSHA